MATTAYAWADKLLAGNLAGVLGGYISEGMSLDQITFELRSHDVIVSRETVRRWVNDLKAAS